MKNRSQKSFDFAIIGAGFAGLSMADELLQRGQNVCLIDKSEPGSGSSGAPLVLINPATGRRAKMVHDAGKSVAAIADLLKRVEGFSGDATFYEKNGIIRPALDTDLAKDFKRSPTKYSWPDNSWIKWLDQEAFSSNYNHLGNHSGGLVVKHGFTIDTQRYIPPLIDYLISKGLTTQFNTNVSITQSDDNEHQLYFDDGSSYKASYIVYATGSSIKNDPTWSFLPFRTTKGQLLDLTFEAPLPLKESISSMGYFAYMPSQPKRLVIGSTYEHSYNNLETDDEGKTALYKKLDRTLPGLSDLEHSVTMWSGVRVSTKDHKPVIGEHPTRNRSYLLSGLGSKGMIQGRYLAKQLAAFILDETPINPIFNLNRFQSF